MSLEFGVALPARTHPAPLPYGELLEIVANIGCAVIMLPQPMGTVVDQFDVEGFVAAEALDPAAATCPEAPPASRP